MASHILLTEFEYCLENYINKVFTYGNRRNLKTELESGIMYLPETKA
jgi:hypothetical protein